MVFENARGTEKIEESFFFVSEEEQKRERFRAKELKQSAWWKQKRSSGICHWCGRKFPVGELTMDHIIPIGKGGKSIKANLVPACKECNHSKKNHLPMDWKP